MIEVRVTVYEDAEDGETVEREVDCEVEFDASGPGRLASPSARCRASNWTIEDVDILTVTVAGVDEEITDGRFDDQIRQYCYDNGPTLIAEANVEAYV